MLHSLFNLFRAPTRVVEPFTDEAGKPRWREVCPQNGKVTSTSGEDFDSNFNRDRAMREHVAAKRVIRLPKET